MIIDNLTIAGFITSVALFFAVIIINNLTKPKKIET